MNNLCHASQLWIESPPSLFGDEQPMATAIYIKSRRAWVVGLGDNWRRGLRRMALLGREVRRLQKAGYKLWTVDRRNNPAWHAKRRPPVQGPPQGPSS